MPARRPTVQTTDLTTPALASRGAKITRTEWQGGNAMIEIGLTTHEGLVHVFGMNRSNASSPWSSGAMYADRLTPANLRTFHAALGLVLDSAEVEAV